MRKNVLWISVLAVTLLCACTAKENNEKPIMTPTPTVTVAPNQTPLPTPTNTPVATPTPTAEQLEKIYLNSLETLDWRELESFVDEETSRQNSNLLNFGYLDYDEEGNIYYINKNDNGIYMSNATGDNTQLLSELNATETKFMLQKEGEWLYYFNNYTKSIEKISLITGDKKVVLENGPYGEFIIENEKIYTRDNGICSFDLEGDNKNVLPNMEGVGICNLSQGTDFWLGAAIFSDKLLKYDGETVVKLKQQGAFPLLSGSYLSIVDPDTWERHIWNLNTKEDVNLEADTEKAIVSDGKLFFYADRSKIRENKEYVTTVYCWNGTISKEILSVEGARSIYHLFLTPEKLYYLADFMKDNQIIRQFWYYDLKTGETGQIY